MIAENNVGMSLIVIAVLSVSCVFCMTRIPENPCPNVFTYTKQGGVIYGELAVPYDGNKNLQLMVNVSMVGVYDTLNLKMDLLTPTDQILTSNILRYRIHFPLQNVIPKITQIAFNERIYCYGPPEPLDRVGVTNLWSSLVHRIKQYTYRIQSGVPTFNTEEATRPAVDPAVDIRSDQKLSTSPPIQQFSEVSPREPTVESCGVTNNIQPLVLQGETTRDNEFPWLVAMFHRKAVTYEFLCTANLISDRHVITAGHCVQFYRALLYQKDDLLLILGRSDLTNWASSGATLRTVSEIKVHPSYRQDSGNCDVAILKFQDPVVFKPNIRPICLWDEDTNLNKIVGSEGVVAGWGKDEIGRDTVPQPRKIFMPVVSQENCLRAHPGFKNLTSDLTFCAGKRDGSGPCTGDSGAGFILKKGSKWFLRGIVSTAIKEEGGLSCDLKQYIVFSDTAKLKDWMKSSLR